MSKHRVEALQDAYRYTIDHSAKAIDKFPADKRFYQVKPGKGNNILD